MGRPRKTVSQHKQNGTYRKDRHDRTAPAVDGTPMPPGDLSGHALTLWNSIEEHVVAIGCGEVDGIMLTAACQWHAAFLDAMAANDTATAARCWRMFDGIVSRFGMTPLDRQKLELPAGENLDDLEAKHFGVVS